MRTRNAQVATRAMQQDIGHSNTSMADTPRRAALLLLASAVATQANPSTASEGNTRIEVYSHCATIKCCVFFIVKSEFSYANARQYR